MHIFNLNLFDSQACGFHFCEVFGKNTPVLCTLKCLLNTISCIIVTRKHPQVYFENHCDDCEWSRELVSLMFDSSWIECG